MKNNMGTADRAIRFLLAILIGILYFAGIISGTWAVVLGILALVFLLTSFISFCPLYLPFDIRTFKKKKP